MNWMFWKKPPEPPKLPLLGFMKIVTKGGEIFKVRITKISFERKELHVQATMDRALTIVGGAALDTDGNELIKQSFESDICVVSGDVVVLVVGMGDE